jgi:hypothetical protein
MKSSLAHLSPTVLAFGAAIGLSLSLFLLSGAGFQGEAVPLLPALGSAARSVDMTPAPTHRSAPTQTAAPVSTAPPAPVSALPAPTPHPTVHRVHQVHHARARARGPVIRPARPAPTPQAPVAVAAPAPAPAPATPVSAPQPVSAPKGKAKALGHQRGHAAKAPVAAAPVNGNGHRRAHLPGHHQKTPSGEAKKAPAAPPNAPAAPAPPKAKGGGPPAEHGGGNGNNGGNGHKGDKK